MLRVAGVAESYDRRVLGFLLASPCLPGLLDSMNAEHVPDAVGRCRGCPVDDDGCLPAWPCQMRPSIDRALAIRVGGGHDAPTWRT